MNVPLENVTIDYKPITPNASIATVDICVKQHLIRQTQVHKVIYHSYMDYVEAAYAYPAFQETDVTTTKLTYEQDRKLDWKQIEKVTLDDAKAVIRFKTEQMPGCYEIIFQREKWVEEKYQEDYHQLHRMNEERKRYPSFSPFPNGQFPVMD